MGKPDQRVTKVMARRHVDGADGKCTAATYLKLRGHHDRSGKARANARHAYYRSIQRRQVQLSKLLPHGRMSVGKRFGLAGNGRTIAHVWSFPIHETAGAERDPPFAETSIRL